MVVGEMAEAVDLLVVGGGPGGYAAALRAAQLGREVVLVDRDGVAGLGGICVRVGCIPSKALIELANAYESLQTKAVAGLRVEGAHIDFHAFQEWKAKLVGGLSRGVGQLLSHAKVRVVHGSVSFTRPDRAIVNTPDGGVSFIEFRHAIVATGSRPIAIPGFEPGTGTVHDSTGVLALDEVPTRVVVIGAGYIGLELGTALAKLGSHVTIVEAADHVLPSLDPALGRQVARSLERRGVEILVGTQSLRMDDADVVVSGPGGERALHADCVLVAVGRRPNSDDMGLAAAGAKLTSTGHVVVDASLRATPNIAAIGDLVAGPALAHKATAEAEVAAEVLCGKPARFDPAAVPAVVFTDPEIATVGLTVAQCREAGMEITVSKFPMSASGRAATLNATDGFVQLVVDTETNAVVGVHMAGPHVSELAGEAALAIEMAASPEDLAATIHPHPTISEAIREAAAIATGQPLHVSR